MNRCCSLTGRRRRVRGCLTCSRKRRRRSPDRCPPAERRGRQSPSPAATTRRPHPPPDRGRRGGGPPARSWQLPAPSDRFFRPAFGLDSAGGRRRSPPPLPAPHRLPAPHGQPPLPPAERTFPRCRWSRPDRRSWCCRRCALRRRLSGGLPAWQRDPFPHRGRPVKPPPERGDGPRHTGPEVPV